MSTATLTVRIRSLGFLVLGLLLFSADSAAQEPRGLFIEDQTKQVTFRAPEKWVFDSASDSEALIFNGPKASGIQYRLTVRALLEGRPYEEAVAHILENHLHLSAEELTSIGPLEGLDSRFLDHGITCLRKVKSKNSRVFMALGRNGPFLVTFTFEVAYKNFERHLPAIMKCLASAEIQAPRPVFTDQRMGLAFYYLPEGFEVKEDQTKAGQSIVWKYRRNDRALGTISVDMMGNASNEELFDAYLDETILELEDNPDIGEVKKIPFYLSGKKGALFEYVIKLDEGKLRNTRWQIYIQNPRYLLMFYCSAETTNFEENLRPVYDRFVHSIDITFELGDKEGMIQ